MAEKFSTFKKEIEANESEARVKEKQWASILKEEVVTFKNELIKNVKTLQDRDLDSRKWVEKAVKEVSEELKGALDKKLIENEVTLKKMLLQGGGSKSIQDNELRAMKEKNLLDFVETMGKNIKLEVKNEIEETRARVNQRLD